MEISVLAAGTGDSILIAFEDEQGLLRHILVDGGDCPTGYNTGLRARVRDLAAAGHRLDLVVVTHQDRDHIQGIRWLLDDARSGAFDVAPDRLFGDFWFNGPKLVRHVLQPQAKPADISLRDAASLEASLGAVASRLDWRGGGTVAVPSETVMFGARLTVLSPTNVELLALAHHHPEVSRAADHNMSIDCLLARYREEQSEKLDSGRSNATSIAFLIEHNGASALMLGDAVPSVLDDSLERLLLRRGMSHLEVDAIKLSHHASQHNLSRRFLAMVHSRRYIVSTNGRRHHHPHKATLAKVLAEARTERSVFYFNYEHVMKSLGCTAGEMFAHRFSCVGPGSSEACELML